MTPPLVITIGRSFGSGGRQLGRVLADTMGLAYYDRELLDQAARAAGVGSEFMEMNDERAPSFFSSILPLSLGMSSHAFFAGSSLISNDSIYRIQSDFIASLPETGPCVIVGRSADYVLRDYPGLVSVFVTAPIESRVARIVGRDPSLSPDKARAIAEKTDKIRSAYYNFYTDRLWGNAASYDLTFDSSRLPIADIAELIRRYVELRFR